MSSLFSLTMDQSVLRAHVMSCRLTHYLLVAGILINVDITIPHRLWDNTNTTYVKNAKNEQTVFLGEDKEKTRK